MGSPLEFFAEIDLSGQFREHDVSMCLAQDTPSPDPSWLWLVGIRSPLLFNMEATSHIWLFV